MHIHSVDLSDEALCLIRRALGMLTTDDEADPQKINEVLKMLPEPRSYIVGKSWIDSDGDRAHRSTKTVMGYDKAVVFALEDCNDPYRLDFSEVRDHLTKELVFSVSPLGKQRAIA